MCSRVVPRWSVFAGSDNDQPPETLAGISRRERTIRCKALLTVLVLVTVAYTSAGTARGADPPRGPVVSEEIVATWTCQSQMGVPRTKARSPWKHHSRRYWTAELNRWRLRHAKCSQRLHVHDETIRRLQRGLAGTPMDGSAGPLEAAGRRWGISPFFIAGIAGTESSFGFAACSGNPYNAFGLSSCTTGWSVPYFRSWGEAYEFMGRFLATRWPHARTTYDYGGYAKCSACWGASTAQHMADRFGVGNSTRYSF